MRAFWEIIIPQLNGKIKLKFFFRIYIYMKTYMWIIVYTFNKHQIVSLLKQKL